jgi:hypothetical protein
MPSPYNSTLLSYLLWLCSLSGVAGIHRFYNKKYVSGAIWLCTGGLLGIGSIIDLFLIPDMVADHNSKIRRKLGLAENGAPLQGGNAIAAVVHQVPSQELPVVLSREQLMIRLVKVAQKYQGQLTVTHAVLETGADFAMVEKTFAHMMRQGYVFIDNHPQTGAVIYRFYDLENDGGGGT